MIIAFSIGVFAKHEGVPWALSTWLGISLLIFSPVRYLIFQVALASSYAVQSFGSAASVFVLALYVPIVFGILYFIGIGLPILPVLAILKDSKSVTFGKGLAVSIILPVACIISSFVFYWALPYAGKTIGWLKVKNVMKATNGPPALIYNNFTSPLTPVILPWYFDDTPQKDIDVLRCHVAAVYISQKKEGYFVKHQYPDIYKKVVAESEKD